MFGLLPVSAHAEVPSASASAATSYGFLNGTSPQFAGGCGSYAGSICSELAGVPGATCCGVRIFLGYSTGGSVNTGFGEPKPPPGGLRSILGACNFILPPDTILHVPPTVTSRLPTIISLQLPPILTESFPAIIS